TGGAREPFRPGPGLRALPDSAAAADALQLLVERRVLLGQEIVRVHVLVIGHIGGAGLTVADRRRRHPAASGILHGGRCPAAALGGAPGSADQEHQCHRQKDFTHPASPIFFNLIHRVRSGASIVAQFRRPWAAQSCAFRTSAMVPSNQTPAATSTTKKPAMTAFSTVRLPSSGGCAPF